MRRAWMCLLVLAACHRRPLPDASDCAAVIDAAFGRQDKAMVAVAAADGGPLWRPAVLEALDRACQSFEDAVVDDTVRVKCLPSLPLMEARPPTARLVTARELAPLDDDDVRRLRGLIGQIDFARGDILDLSMERVSFIHLPLGSLDGVDVEGLFNEVAGRERTSLQMALDLGGRDDLGAYRRLAPIGPSASQLIAVVDAGEPGGLKEPTRLLALQRAQAAAEAQPRVAQSFSVVDDVTMVRRGLHRGNPADAVIPARRAEVAQLLLALSLNPMGTAYGARIDAQEQLGLLQLNLAPGTEEQREKLARRLEPAMQQATGAELRLALCAEATPLRAAPSQIDGG